MSLVLGIIICSMLLRIIVPTYTHVASTCRNIGCFTRDIRDCLTCSCSAIIAKKLKYCDYARVNKGRMSRAKRPCVMTELLCYDLTNLLVPYMLPCMLGACCWGQPCERRKDALGADSAHLPGRFPRCRSRACAQSARVRVHACVCVCVRVRACARVTACVHACVRACARARACVRAWVRACTFIHSHMCRYDCICTTTRIGIKQHAHTQLNTVT